MYCNMISFLISQLNENMKAVAQDWK
uniref:Uncharacterized protein n=1 Tax=Rhizophora mucronata TaxID=61149 RepID=A0A2P2IWN5_RHIMU